MQKLQDEIDKIVSARTTRHFEDKVYDYRIVFTGDGVYRAKDINLGITL